MHVQPKSVIQFCVDPVQFGHIFIFVLKKTDFVISENPKKNLEKDTGMAPKYLENKML